MEKLSQLVSKLTQVQRRFESFLDNEFENKIEEREHIQKNFEASRDLALVRGLSQGLPEDHIDRAIVVFSRLALMFDAGILLENFDGVWKPQAHFYRGITELSKSNTKNSLQLPATNLMTVLKTSAKQVLDKLQLQQLDPENKSTCIVIKATSDFAFVLFSTTADLWLKDHVENVRHSLINGFLD